MSILADLSALQTLFQDAEALASGPVTIEISAPVHVVITAANGKVILDTVLQVNQQTTGGPAAPPSS